MTYHDVLELIELAKKAENGQLPMLSPTALISEIIKLRRALEFYAEAGSWMDGAKARRALGINNPVEHDDIPEDEY